MHHFTVTNNLFGGFGYTVNFDTDSGGAASNITFTDNTYTTALAPQYGPLFNTSGVLSTGSLWRRNKWLVPAGAQWGLPQHDGYFWMPVAADNHFPNQDDSLFVSLTDYTG